MPKLSDLLSDNTRKELITESKKAKRSEQKKSRKNYSSGSSHRNSRLFAPNFVALDLETTGLNFKNDRIIEIGAVKFIRGKPEEEFVTFINPGVQIPLAISELTHISNDDIANAPTFYGVYEKLLAFIGNLPICGHQIEFDLTFINEELKRRRLSTVSLPLLDTALLSRILLQSSIQRFSLKHVSEHLKVTLDDAHRALPDAMASGYVAVQLVPMLAELPIEIRRTMAACSPGSYFKSLLLRSLGSTYPEVKCTSGNTFTVPSQLSLPETLVAIEREEIRSMFSDEGALAGAVPGFTARSSQIEMALQVADSLNTRSFLIAEAGTGTGKSLAYLVPAAKWAMENTTRILISTRTKNLQDQLINHDLPILEKTLGEDFHYAVLKGRSNYICRNRWLRMLTGEIGNLSPRERLAILPLIPWVESTKTGDIEEQNQFSQRAFSKIWNLISAESHDCLRRHCKHFRSCFFQHARRRALGSHIVVINHALFFSDICAENSFLGKIGPIIFDEAHHLVSSGYRHLRVELDTNRINLFMESSTNLVQKTGSFGKESEFYQHGKEMKTHLRHFRKRAQSFLEELGHWARSQHPEMTADYQFDYGPDAFDHLHEAYAFELSLKEMIDRLFHLKQAIIGADLGESVEELQSDVQALYERASQMKADFLYLFAAKTEEHVFWVEGNHGKGWTKLCGVPLDIASLLSKVWERCEGGIVYTSATLAISESTEYFRQAVGLVPHAQNTAEIMLKSPFGPHQIVTGAVQDAPDPDAPEFARYVGECIRQLHKSTKKNILVLFTSNAMLENVFDVVRSSADIDQGRLLAQGFSGSRHVMLEQFIENRRMILLGTDSFWEGIDAPGEACEIVIIPRLPFLVPTHPLTKAIAQRMEAIHGESFYTYTVPEAVMKYRQGAGRLIRTISDRGALIVLDSRILTKNYGREFVRVVDGAFDTFENVSTMVNKVVSFFASEPQEPVSTVTYVPIDDI